MNTKTEEQQLKQLKQERDLLMEFIANWLGVTPTQVTNYLQRSLAVPANSDKLP